MLCGGDEEGEGGHRDVEMGDWLMSGVRMELGRVGRGWREGVDDERSIW